MAAVAEQAAAPGGRLAALGDRSTLAIALGAGLAALSMNVWIPFLPLFLLDLGATSDANAVFWAGLATTGLGFGRLVSGPFWGILSDRLGRKIMFVRALAFATLTTLIAAAATEPWHVVVAYACQGVFSGFMPAAIALTSVTVPDSRLNSALGVVSGTQYTGSTLGPAIGSALALAFGFRGAMVGAALMPAVAALLVFLMVPKDEVAPRPVKSAGEPAPSGSWLELLTFQFGLALFLYFLVFAAAQLVRTVVPIAISDLHDGESKALVGAAFTLAGVASVAGIIAARRLVPAGRMRAGIIAGCGITAVAHILLAFAAGVPLFILWFAAISLIQAAMIPATNTLIAANAPRARRGTAFGFAGSAQALAFMVGPMGAAVVTALSLEAGIVTVGVLFVGIAALVFTLLREPELAAR
ncbi:MAG: MFS transporter [Dehalococcoidia bacterium]|nr:MFS transporter [Dehalococcoidia bacterium]